MPARRDDRAANGCEFRIARTFQSANGTAVTDARLDTVADKSGGSYFCYGIAGACWAGSSDGQIRQSQSVRTTLPELSNDLICNCLHPSVPQKCVSLTFAVAWYAGSTVFKCMCADLCFGDFHQVKHPQLPWQNCIEELYSVIETSAPARCHPALTFLALCVVLISAEKAAQALDVFYCLQ